MQFISPTATSRWRSRSLATTVAASALLLGACIEDFSAPDPTGPVADVLISTIPLNQAMEELFIGTTRQLLAGPQNADGQFVPGHSVTWSSSNETVVSITQAGVATAVSSGTATISATAGGVTGTTEIKVRFPVGQVTVTPAGGTIRREGAIPLTANVVDGGGTPRTNRTVTWTSLSPAVATVSATGLVSGVTDGQAIIRATSEGVSGQATITVFGSPVIATITVTPASTVFLGVGMTQQMAATARAGSGTIITDANVTWSSSSDAVATVSATGLVTVHSAGSVTITATADGISGFSNFNTVASLVSGVPVTVPTIGPASFAVYAVLLPAGATSLTVSTTGGSGDADVYLFAPGIVPSDANTDPNFFAFSNFTCASAASGNTESCTRTAASGVGVWRVHVFAWGPAGAVTGLQITATVTP